MKARAVEHSIAALLVLIAGMAATGGVLDRFSADQRAKLLRGEPIYEYVVTENTGDSFKGYGRANILIEAPIDKCYEMFARYDQEYMWLPYMTVSKVVSRDGNTAVVYKELDLTLITLRYYVIFTADPEARRFDFKLDPSRPSDQKESEGYFMFEKVDDDTTLFTYALTKSELDMPVPEFIQNYVTSRDLPHIALNLKKWVESDGKWEK